MTKPDAVILDIGNVLIGWDPDHIYAELIPDPAARAAFFQTTGLAEMNERIDLGAPFKQTIYAQAERHPQHRDLIRAWHDRWIQMASPVIDQSVALLRRLRAQGTPVHALTNFGIDSFAYAETIYPFLQEFDQRFISGHMGVIKPDPRIYAQVEVTLSLSGPQIFFVDDRVKNIAAAQARDWQGYVFTGPDRLETALEDLGILTT